MLQEEKEAEQMLARKYVLVPILQPKLLGRVGIKTHIINLKPHRLEGPQTKGDKIRIGCLTPAFSGAQKKAEMLCHPCILGGLQTKEDEIRIGCLTPIKTYTRGKNDAPTISKYGSLVWPNAQIVALRANCAKPTGIQIIFLGPYIVHSPEHH